MKSQIKPSPSDEDIALRAWAGDESAQAELVLALAGPLEIAMRNKFGISVEDAEDVVCEAIRLFWNARDRYDPSRSLKAYIYRIAEHVGKKHVAGHLRWQKSMNLERQIDNDWLLELPEQSTTNQEPGDCEPQKAICRAVQDSLETLNELERQVVEAYARAGDIEINASALGIELGIARDGIPIPATTIRQNKLRGIRKIEAAMKRQGFDPRKSGGRS